MRLRLSRRNPCLVINEARHQCEQIKRLAQHALQRDPCRRREQEENRREKPAAFSQLERRVSVEERDARGAKQRHEHVRHVKVVHAAGDREQQRQQRRKVRVISRPLGNDRIAGRREVVRERKVARAIVAEARELALPRERDRQRGEDREQEEAAAYRTLSMKKTPPGITSTGWAFGAAESAGPHMPA